MRDLFNFNSNKRIKQPVLSDDEVNELFNRGAANRSSRLQLDHIGESYSGSRPTSYRGSGLDYEDSRAYQSGDDLRHINWRQTAKTSQVLTSIFTEEHEPAVILIIDRRASMRFGTRERLKITRAAEICCYLAGYYFANGFAVGMLLLQTQTQHFKPLYNRSKIQQYLQRAVQACPPVRESKDEPGLVGALTFLRHQGYKNTQVIVISDFHDINDGHRDLLAGFHQSNKTHFYQIIDPMEMSLPAAGNLLLEGHDDHEIIKLNLNDSGFRQNYEQLISEEQNQLDNLCFECQIPCVRIMSQLQLSDVIDVMNYG